MTDKAAACFVLNLQIGLVFCGIKCHQEINCLPEGVRINVIKCFKFFYARTAFIYGGAVSLGDAGVNLRHQVCGPSQEVFRAEGFDSRRQERAKPYEKIRLSMLLKRIFYVWDDICMSLSV